MDMRRFAGVWLRAVVVLVGVVWAPIVWGQDAKPGAETPETKDAGHASDIEVKADLVVLPTVVRDGKKGALVGGLTKDNFELTVGGKAQTIRYFDHEADVPLTLGLVVDASRGMRELLDESRDASKGFVDAMMAGGGAKLVQASSPAVAAGGGVGGSAGGAANKGFVVQFAKQIELLQEVTDQSPKLQAALKLLGTETATFHTVDAGDSKDSEGRTVHHGGTSFYDAVFLSADEVMAKQMGRKVLVVFTDGVDVGSKETLTEAIEAAQRADTMVYAVYEKGTQTREQNDRQASNKGGYPGASRYPGGRFPGSGGGYPGDEKKDPNSPNSTGGTSTRKPSIDGRQVLERLCGETGGRMFEVGKKQSVEEIYGLITEDLKGQYRIAFTPEGPAAKYGYHQIDLEMTGENAKKKLDVQVRDGYYAGDSK